jgi:cold shock CspA family protein
MIPTIFTVSKYIPNDLYGFLEGQDEDGVQQRVFFHSSEFDPMGGPPPIVGERVTVGSIEPVEGKNSRAVSVTRCSDVKTLVGKVSRFNHQVGYGFVTVDGNEYFLHRSELQDGALPLIGAMVEFSVAGSVGTSKSPRACHASILSQGTK